MKKLIIATRSSPLALWQSTYIQQCLHLHHPHIEIELLKLTTQGDKILDAPLAKIGGKGLFVKELEHALLEGRADIAVHSTKDVPMELPEGLQLAVLCKRDDPRDCMVSAYPSFSALPAGAKVGTSSLRRQSQLSVLRNDVQLIDVRGNIHTRLTRLENGDFDALILASAGLQRMNLGARIQQNFPAEILLPAVGQGVLGIEMRSGDTAIEKIIMPLHDSLTAICVTAERAMNSRLQGGCQVPIAGYAVIEQGALYLRGLVGAVDGHLILRAEHRITLSSDQMIAIEQAKQLGFVVADQLLADGAGELLKLIAKP